MPASNLNLSRKPNDSPTSFRDFIRNDDNGGLIFGSKLLLDLKSEVEEHIRETSDPRSLRLRERIIRKLDAIELEIERRKRTGSWDRKRIGNGVLSNQNTSGMESIRTTSAIGDEIIECIDSTLHSMDTRLAYSVYSYWSLVDGQSHKGILGDPEGFVDCLYELFGEKGGRLVEHHLSKALWRRFGYIMNESREVGVAGEKKRLNLESMIRELRTSEMSRLNQRLAVNLL